jgi:hypothetical protein
MAQAALILLLVGVVGWQARHTGSVSPVQPPAVYRTLSNPDPAPVPSVRLRVMFWPKATEREIRDLLHGVNGEITAGPSRSGAYTVEVPASGDPAGVVLARLRSEPQVVMLAEPATGELGTARR